MRICRGRDSDFALHRGRFSDFAVASDFARKILRKRCDGERIASGVGFHPENPITGPAPEVRQRGCPRSLADGVFFHHSHALPSILAWAQGGHRIATLNPGVGTGLPRCFPENAGSAVLYSTALPENTGSASVHTDALPDSPPFPASNLGSKNKAMGKIKLFPVPEYSSKQSSDPVVPLVPCTGIFLGPSKSGKTVTLISLILERIYIFSPSIDIDDGWIPVKKYIEEDLGVNTEREQAYWEDWDEAALRRIIQQQRKITEASKKLEMKKLYQVLVILDDVADMPQLHKPNGALDTLFIRGRHMQISTWVSSQKLRLISAAVRVNQQFLCCWRLRNQHELDAVVEELSALLPKEQLYQLYEQATREPYSFLFVYYPQPSSRPSFAERVASLEKA